jgi:chromosome segregation ATPase
MEYTDVLYGVTMQEPGISSLVSVELRGEQRPLPEKPDADVAVA